MVLVAVIALVVVFSCLGWAMARCADVGDLQMEEPVRWDDPDWEPEWVWPVVVRDARVDRVIREMERSL